MSELPSSKFEVSGALSFASAFLAIALPLVGITVNLYLGALFILLFVAFLLYALWHWPWLVRRLDPVPRTSVLWVFALVLMVGAAYQIHGQYAASKSAHSAQTGSTEQDKQPAPVPMAAAAHPAARAGAVQKVQKKKGASAPETVPPTTKSTPIDNPHPGPATASEAQTSAPTQLPPPQMTDFTIHSAGTAILYCNPTIIMARMDITTTTPTEPAVDVGSARCQQELEKSDLYKTYASFKASVTAHAGDRKLIESDLATLSTRLDTSWKGEDTALRARDDANLAKMKKQLLGVADDRVKTLALMSSMAITTGPR